MAVLLGARPLFSRRRSDAHPPTIHGRRSARPRCWRGRLLGGSFLASPRRGDRSASGRLRRRRLPARRASCSSATASGTASAWGSGGRSATPSVRTPARATSPTADPDALLRQHHAADVGHRTGAGRIRRRQRQGRDDGEQRRRPHRRGCLRHRDGDGGRGSGAGGLLPPHGPGSTYEVVHRSGLCRPLDARRLRRRPRRRRSPPTVDRCCSASPGPASRCTAR